MRMGVLRQSRHNNPHPRPNLEVEERSRGSGEVFTRKMTEEEWLKYGPLNTKVEPKINITNIERNEVDVKHPHLTKEFFDAEFAKGKSGEQIIREQKLPAGSLNYYLKRVGAVNPNSRPFGTGGDTTKKARTEEITPVAVEPNKEVVKGSDSFIQATVERDQQILAKASPKKSGRLLQLDVTDSSYEVESELNAVLGYVQAMPDKNFKLEVSLVEVVGDE